MMTSGIAVLRISFVCHNRLFHYSNIVPWGFLIISLCVYECWIEFTISSIRVAFTTTIYYNVLFEGCNKSKWKFNHLCVQVQTINIILEFHNWNETQSLCCLISLSFVQLLRCCWASFGFNICVFHWCNFHLSNL